MNSQNQHFVIALNLRIKFSGVAFGVDDIVGIQERSWNAHDSAFGLSEGFTVQTNIHLSSGTTVTTDGFCDSVLETLAQNGRKEDIPVVHEIRLPNAAEYHTHRWVSKFLT